VPPPWEDWHDDLAALIEAARKQGSLKANALAHLKAQGKSDKYRKLWTMYFVQQKLIDQLRDKLLGVTFEPIE
jgi:hypothetical protein